MSLGCLGMQILHNVFTSGYVLWCQHQCLFKPMY